ncbi:hypothetical protein DUI87_30364 [Hirundo rustica rustica]|uniref:Uncharacterized protein n=1 Tax=Hirundo rustica rustica TaxID=333673 RepID=A0A3M0IXJ5_HIRRU|nr:hypothetical protein DUI87_30364 [Hirundo rustica rustica]
MEIHAHRHNIGQIPVIWNLTNEPGLVLNDGDCLHDLICQLPHHPGVDPIGTQRFINIQAAQQFFDCLLLGNRETILLPDTI